MLLYIRHGDDRGDDVYRHDRPLNDRGKERAAKEARWLIKQYGLPDVVRVSPFRRAIETVETMSRHFTKTVAVRRDPRIAQCLSEKQRRDPQVSPETLAQVTIDEDLDAFRRRIADHAAEMRHAHGMIWCVTHQAVIEEIAVHFGVRVSADLDFLDHVVMLG